MDSKNFYSQATESSQRPDKSSRKKNKTVSIYQIKKYIVEIQELKADIKEKQNKDKSFYDGYCKKFKKWVNKFMMIPQIEESEEYAVILLPKLKADIKEKQNKDKSFYDGYCKKFEKWVNKFMMIPQIEESEEYAVILLPIMYQVIDDDLTSMNKMFYPTIIESEEICKLKIEIKKRMIKELSGKVNWFSVNMSLHNPSLTFSDLMNLAKIYNNITEISHEISKILCDFKKNLNSKYQFGQWFSEKLENPKKNKKELINKTETLSKDFNYLTKLNRCDINFREFGGEEFINSLTEQLKELRIKLPQKMQEFFITKLNKNLDICLQIMEIFMINLDTETNTLLNFSEVYYKYKNKYRKLIRNIFDKLEDNLEKDNLKDFRWNFSRLKETDRINYASNNNAQIIERLKGYIEEAFKENKDNIDDFAIPFFQKAKKYKLIFDYIKFKCDFKIIKRLEKKNKNWIGKPNIEKWEKIVKKLPSIFNNYLFEFRCFAFKECKEFLETKQVPKIMEIIGDLPTEETYDLKEMILTIFEKSNIDIGSMIYKKQFVPALELCENQMIFHQKIFNEIPQSRRLIENTISLLLPAIKENKNKLKLESENTNFRQKYLFFKEYQLARAHKSIKEILKNYPQGNNNLNEKFSKYLKLLKKYESLFSSFFSLLIWNFVQSSRAANWCKDYFKKLKSSLINIFSFQCFSVKEKEKTIKIHEKLQKDEISHSNEKALFKIKKQTIKNHKFFNKEAISYAERLIKILNIFLASKIPNCSTNEFWRIGKQKYNWNAAFSGKFSIILSFLYIKTNYSHLDILFLEWLRAHEDNLKFNACLKRYELPAQNNFSKKYQIYSYPNTCPWLNLIIERSGGEG